jgi:hypothetical protein
MNFTLSFFAPCNATNQLHRTPQLRAFQHYVPPTTRSIVIVRLNRFITYNVFPCGKGTVCILQLYLLCMLMYCKKTKPGKKREKRKNIVIRFITCDDISIKHTCTCTCTVQHVLYTTYITHVCGTTNRVHMVYTHTCLCTTQYYIIFILF